jgi:transposase
MDEAVKRRVKAGRMLMSGNKPAEVAKAVGVARQTVYTWARILEEGGIDALREINVGGRPAKLGPEQFERLRELLLEGAQAQGFGTQLWTIKRVRHLIEREFAHRYSEVHVWRILGGLGFSSQKPDRRAIERDEDTVHRFKRHTLPKLKKKLSKNAG